MSVVSRVHLTVMVCLALVGASLLAAAPAAEAAPVSVPTITAPTDSASVNTPTITVSATSTAANVTFVLDGRGGSFTTNVVVAAGEASANMSVIGLDGSTSVEAFDCDGTDCNALGADITVDIGLDAPTLTAPVDGDIVGSSVVAEATADGGAVRFRVNGGSASTDLDAPYSKTLSLTGMSDGDLEIDAVRCDASGTVCEGPASSSVTVVKDTKGPRWTDVRSSMRTVYPARDNYKDSTVFTARVGEEVRAVKVEVRKVGGGLVRVIALGARDAGRVAAAWNGRRGNGDVVGPGKYSFRFVGSDLNGQSDASAARTVYVSDKRLVRKSVVRTMTAQGAGVGDISGSCGGVYSTDYAQSRFGWRKGLAYYSRSKCNGSRTDDVAAAVHKVGVPKAIRYGKAKVNAFGAGAFRHPGPAFILYIKSNKEYGKVKQLGSSVGWHSGGSVPLDNYLVRGSLFWTIATTNGNWYDIKEFKVSMTYYVLR